MAIDKADKREANGIERLESRDRACESDIKEKGKRERERERLILFSIA